MVYINTIREWQDILAIVPWTSLKKLLISLFYTKLKRPGSCLDDSVWVWEKTAPDALQKLLNGVVLLCNFICSEGGGGGGWSKKVWVFTKYINCWLQSVFHLILPLHKPTKAMWMTTVYMSCRFGFTFLCLKRRSFTNIKAYCTASRIYNNTYLLENDLNVQQQ